MKTKDEITKVLDKMDDSGFTQYPGMNYEQGVAEALSWVIGYIPDDEFSPLDD